MIVERQQLWENFASMEPSEERRVIAMKLSRLFVLRWADPLGLTFVLLGISLF